MSTNKARSARTRRELIEAALKQLGYSQQPSTTRKASTWRWAATPPQDAELIFVGKLGSVRKGRVYTQSLALPAGTIARLIAKGERVLKLQAAQVQK